MSMISAAIDVEAVGKQYMIGGRRRSAPTLADSVSNFSSRLREKLKAVASRAEPGSIHNSGAERFWALRNVTFSVRPGEILGIIGRNGSGKSTLLKILSRITPPTEGEATIVGRVGSLLEIGTGFHGELTGRENIFLSGTILGMKTVEISQRFDEIVDFSGVERFIDTPVKHYSSGMYLRLAFAVAAHLRTEILLIDEVLAVGDAAFQKKCIEKMSSVAQEGRTVLFVSHNLPAVSRLCTHGVYLEAGRVKKVGTVTEVLDDYQRSLRGENQPAQFAGSDGVVVSRLQSGARGSHFGPSEPLRLSCVLFVKKVYWQLSVQLGIVRADGSSIVIDTIDSADFPILSEIGKYSLDIRLPTLWLSPGGYAARIKIIAHPPDSPTERYFSEWFDFFVEAVQERQVAPGQALSPTVDWSVTDCDSPES